MAQNPDLVELLNAELAERLASLRDYPALVKALAHESQIPQKPNQGQDSALEYAASLFSSGDYTGSLNAFAHLLGLNPNSPEAHHYIGMILVHNELYTQANLLFDKGLRLDVPDVSDEFRTPNFHRRFHFDLVDMAHWMKTDHPEMHLYDIGYSLKIFQSKDKEKKFVSLHNNLAKIEYLGGKPHKADNCPYLRNFKGEIAAW